MANVNGHGSREHGLPFRKLRNDGDETWSYRCSGKFAAVRWRASVEIAQRMRTYVVSSTVAFCEREDRSQEVIAKSNVYA